MPGGQNFVTEQVYAATRDINLPALRRLYRDYFARTGVAAIEFDAPAGSDRTSLSMGVSLERALGAIRPPAV